MTSSVEVACNPGISPNPNVATTGVINSQNTVVNESGSNLAISNIGEPRDMQWLTGPGEILIGTLSGYTLRVTYDGGAWNVHNAVDLGVNAEVDRNSQCVSVRQGAIDPVSGGVWLPVQHLLPKNLSTSNNCSSYNA